MVAALGWGRVEGAGPAADGNGEGAGEGQEVGAEEEAGDMGGGYFRYYKKLSI